jgi:hypothetical protein
MRNPGKTYFLSEIILWAGPETESAVELITLPKPPDKGVSTCCMPVVIALLTSSTTLKIWTSEPSTMLFTCGCNVFTCYEK